MTRRISRRAALVVRGNDGGTIAERHTTGGITCQGQSERPKPDPRRGAHPSQVAANRPAGAHDRTGLKRWTGSVEQDRHAEGVGTARAARSGQSSYAFRSEPHH